MTLKYWVGDTRDVTATIPDGSVDLIFTSPPFLALRSYLPSDHEHKHREIGSEPNPAAFLDVLLDLTAEWGRVLAPHGTLAVELGDTYSGSTADAGWDRLGPRQDNAGGNSPGKAAKAVAARAEGTWARKANGWPLAKSLAGIPQLYMIGLAYGINPLTGEQSPAGRWRVRNWIAWHRPNPPVGALGDKWRPASSYITVACKGARRWFDLDAVRTETDRDDLGGLRKGTPRGTDERRTLNGETANMTGSNPAGAPPLDWHTDGDLGVGHIILSTQPYPGSHYATFPVDLPRKIIDCMCPRQVCRVCGVARERVVNDKSAFEPQAKLAAHIKERRLALGITSDEINGWFGYKEIAKNWERTDRHGAAVPNPKDWPTLKERLGLDNEWDAFVMGERKWTEFAGEYINHTPNGEAVANGRKTESPAHSVRVDVIRKDLGWSDCGHDSWRPGIVYDPFAGSGTTLEAAQDLGRDGIGADLDERNSWLARERLGMFAEFDTLDPDVVDVVSDLL